MTHLTINQSQSLTENVPSNVIEKLYRLALNSKVENASNLLEMSLSGTISAPAAYEDAVLYLRAKFPNLTINVPETSFYIRFVDATFEELCILRWGDGVGVTRGALAEVTSYNDSHDCVFYNRDAHDLSGMQYFSGLSTYSGFFRHYGTWEGVETTNDNIREVPIGDIVMPKNKSMYNKGYIIDLPDWRCAVTCNNINWNGATLDTQAASQNEPYPPVFRGVFIDYYDGILPNLSIIPNLFINNALLSKMIFPEGTTLVHWSFRGCSTTYIEFPTTVTNIEGTFDGFRRDSTTKNSMHGHLISGGLGCIVFKSVTPPTIGNIGGYTNFPNSIYVPNNSVDAYKTAFTGTDLLVNAVKPLSELLADSNLVALGTVTQEDAERT